ncbi:BTAD domain-containing putative transcriptional regulator [Streptomyces sp. NPDC008125]|uniref:AfsR/SARP family transcriptional regulator n=1 Tax=Streptomyces sp. NPDC008125 TaxID=3364811 RepID=UPI0036E52415
MVDAGRGSGPRNPGLLINILGPLEGWSGEEQLVFGGQVQKRILATLLLDPGRVIPAARLAEAAWGEEPPTTVAHQVRKAIADLRRRMPQGASVILTDGAGYRVKLGEGQLDLLEFHGLTRTASRSLREGRPAQAAEALRAALALWRGPALMGVGGPVVDAAATALEDRRLAAADQLFELRLLLGESSELIAELRTLISGHPLRETLRGHLMLALYRSGRQAEALEEYGRVRDLLVERLGVDPSPQLAELHTGILRGNPALALPESSAPREFPDALHASLSAPAPLAPPCTLPPGLSDFTGRDRELTELLGHLRKGSRAGGGPCAHLVAIDGMGGAGKTSLAVHAAHLLAGEYPDGQLAVDLRGFTPGETPVEPSTALDMLLRALGVPADRIPDELEGRTGLWRSALGDHRLLLLLDNAANADQIRPLLPTTSGCLVLTTSRARLVDLDGAEWVSVGLLSPEESTSLMAETLSPERLRAEPEAAAELAELCGHLPLALRIATARLRNRPRWTIRYLVERLRDETRRLDELRSGERSVAATLQLSYLAMDERHRTAFRLLGLHPGMIFDVHSAAALLGTGAKDAEDLLETLLDVHMVQQPGIGLYTFHDLVRSFSQDLGGSAADGAAASQAFERLLSYYVTTTDAACELISSGRASRPSGLEPYTGARPVFPDKDAATEWFAREHSGLLATVTLAGRQAHDRHTVALTRNLNFLLHSRGQFDMLWNLGHLAVSAARRLGDPGLLCVALSNLGSACWKLGRFEEGLAAAEEGRDIARRQGDRHTEAHSEANMGLLLSELGRYREALPLVERAIVLAADLGSTRSEAENLTVLSTLYERWGRHTEAADAALRAMETSRANGYRSNEIMALADLAFARVGLGEYEEAGQLLKCARELCGETTGPGDSGLVHALSAKVAHLLGDDAAAREFAGSALVLARSSGTQIRLVKVENLVGDLHFDWREYAVARKLYAHAHTMAASMRFRPEDASALLGLARVAEAFGETHLAVEHRAEAASLLAFMEVPQPVRG